MQKYLIDSSGYTIANLPSGDNIAYVYAHYLGAHTEYYPNAVALPSDEDTEDIILISHTLTSKYITASRDADSDEISIAKTSTMPNSTIMVHVILGRL